uniref:Pleckstrin homology and RhoGEF domain containing G3 n=1 Tax=Meleagris gallopavo TaxID=9103 RepID=A0A803YP80_MELGA
VGGLRSELNPPTEPQGQPHCDLVLHPQSLGMPVPTLGTGPDPGMEEEASGDGKEPWLGNSNNNAAPVGWLCRQGEEPSYLQRVLLEIVESERTYARDLRGIVEGYLGKIIDAQEPPLRPEQVSALFGNIEDIYELSSNLLQSLESCACDPVAVAVCFVTRSQEFDIYTQYCNNYPNSVATLSECMRSKQQARFFRECQEEMRHVLPLGAYLLKPVQRILKYHLLLQEIAKHFEHKSGDDYEVVVEAIDTMTCVAWYINDMKRKHEHAIRQQEIQSLLLQWKGPDLTTYGELVLEGSFRAQRARSERAVFLFDKLLLITKRRGDHYVYKSHIPCTSLMLIESTRDSLCFSVAHYKHIKQQYALQAKSAEEKRVWTHHIKRLILENHHAIVPQKAKEAILEMDLFCECPYVPRCPLVSHCLPSSPIILFVPMPTIVLTTSLSTTVPTLTPYPPLSTIISTSHEGLGTPAPPSPSGSLPPAGLPDEEEQHPETGTGEDPRALSSEEEEEEEEEEGHGSGSILPPSVLDQASVIAERFGSSMSRRGSMVLDGRSGSALSLDGVTPPQENMESCSPLPSPGSPQGCRRRSLLSTQDRLLLRKIRSYYEHAEHQDAGFSIRRRESLSYIPKGLVRNSVSRINSWPPLEPGSPKTPTEPVSPKVLLEPGSPKSSPEPVSPKTSLEPASPQVSLVLDGGVSPPVCRENGLPEPSTEPLLILEEEEVPPPGVLALGAPPRRLTSRVYQLARQYSLRIKSRRRGIVAPGDNAIHTPASGGMRWGTAGIIPLPPSHSHPTPFTPGVAKLPVSPRDGITIPAPRSPPSPSGSAEAFSWPDVRELRARFGGPRPPPVTRSRSAPEGPERGGDQQPKSSRVGAAAAALRPALGPQMCHVAMTTTMLRGCG